MAININREVEDTFYRYKMPKLAAKVEGKGNGIKTVIVNVSDIAKALYRKPIYLTKYFGCELGAQIYVDDKNERYIVNGAHEAAKLQELLDGFIKKFVLCQNCGNPETTMHVNKKSLNVSTTCKACGNQGHLDVTHRLTQFIVKNPPDPDPNATKSKSKKGQSKKTKGTEKNSDEDNENIDDNERVSSVNITNDEDDDWLEETNESARQQRLNTLSAMAKSLALCDEVEKSETERADVFFKHLTKLYEHDKILSQKREIKQEADNLELGARAILVLAEVLLNVPSTMISDIKKYAPLFLLFTRTGDDQQRYQQYLWGAMGKMMERHSSENLINKACHILKQLYDCDIIEEDVILAWFQKGFSRKFISKELSAKIVQRCKPMVDWLREAEEESEEEEKEERKEEKSIETTNGNGQHEESASEDEVDIDAI